MIPIQMDIIKLEGTNVEHLTYLSEFIRPELQISKDRRSLLHIRLIKKVLGFFLIKDARYSFYYTEPY